MSLQHSITIPPVHPARRPLRLHPADPRANGRRPSLVIVDDDELLRDLLGEALTAQGYDVRCAENGEAGWQSLCAEPFDLIITDFEMPKLNGLDLLRRMRAASLNQPAILMSGNMPKRTPELEQLLLPGAAVAKPFSFTNLLPDIAALLILANSGKTPHSLPIPAPV
ncbi:MAG: response regulator [Opitutales bacterium]|nr:response regulator [Opitutales bacterium]